ncbi:hypothetical protein Forpe1208_v010551 [Fusarium oxysporum f. sp. rapae]|uniref:Chitin-binding type-2 domain-containing protein n=1 Tax=Fusarium oxysporum f. sp. rapae TaxID=485398 RepID=A0A8J5NS01_FUSOX|nr:hypothetical protein Forpe1208_v010551 [Fusarium oxysporum f. sp. rapae]
MKLIAFRKFTTTPNIMSSLTLAALFLLGLVNAGVVRTPAEASTLTSETTTPVTTPDAFVAKGEKMASCNIQCAFWYQKCYYAPWAYSCGNDGRFRRHEWNPICEKNCWCNCDSK